MSERPADPVDVPDGPEGPGEDAPTDGERRLRCAHVFGDVLPDSTSDERGDGWSEPDYRWDGADDWLRRQVPPHHG